MAGGAEANGRLPSDPDGADAAADLDEEGELPDTLEEALLDAASELPGLIVRGEGDRRQFLVGQQLVALLDGDLAEFRLDPAVATAALRTPGVRRSASAPDRITFEPDELDLYALDRAVAWLRSAVRKAG